MGIMDEANNHIVRTQIKEAAEQSKGYYELLATVLKCVYEECKNVGFNDKQSFDFAKEYTLKTHVK